MIHLLYFISRGYTLCYIKVYYICNAALFSKRKQEKREIYKSIIITTRRAYSSKLCNFLPIKYVSSLTVCIQILNSFLNIRQSKVVIIKQNMLG